MSALRSIFEKYLPLPQSSERKRKLAEENAQLELGAHNSKLPRLSVETKSRLFPKGWPFHRKSVVEVCSPPQRKMATIDLDSDDDVELVDYLMRKTGPTSSHQNPKKTFSSTLGAPIRPPPPLIAYNTFKQSPQRTMLARNGSVASSHNVVPRYAMASHNSNQHHSDEVPLPLPLWRNKAEDGPCPRRPATIVSRSEFMVNSARQRAFEQVEREKYGRMVNQIAPSIYPKTTYSGGWSLFGSGACKKNPVQANLSPPPISGKSAKNSINWGGRNSYCKMLEEYSMSLDPQRGSRVPQPKRTEFVDLTQQAVVELTEDEDENGDVEDEVVVMERRQQPQQRPVVTNGTTGDNVMAIPSMFPYLNSSNNYGMRPRSVSPEMIEDTESVQTGDKQRARRKVEEVKPVNSLRDQFNVNPMFQDHWLEATRRRYSASQEERNQLINQELETCRRIEEDGRASMQGLIRKLDEAMLLTEVIVIEDEEQLAAEAAAAASQKASRETTPLPVFTQDQVKQIRYAMGRGHPDEVLVSKFNLNITRRDIGTLIGDAWLNDEVINFYMNLLMDRGTGCQYPKVYAMNTFFMPKVLQSGQAGVRRWTRKVDIFSYDIIPVPVHVSNIHWCMAIIDMRQHTIRYYDSMGQPNRRVLDALEQYLRDESEDKRKETFDTSDWIKESVLDCPRQMNGSDCGVFSCMFAEYVTRNHEINFSQENMPYFREKMILEIVSGKLLL